MIIDVKDLQVGDEILVGTSSHFKWMKVVRPVKFQKGSTDRYSAVRCSTKINITQIPVYGWGANHNTILKTRDKKVYELTGEGHNTEEYVNLNYKQAWLLYRNGQKV